jgi:hypothetical protein
MTIHWIPIGIVAYVAYSTAVDAMDVPKPTDSRWYRFLYRFAHTFAGNLFTAFGKIGRTPWPGEEPRDEPPAPSGPWPPQGTH